MELAACGQRAALYRPELAQIAGQLHLLAERLMDFPSQDPIVLRAIAGVPEVRPKGSHPQPDEDLKRLAELSGGFRSALAQAEASAAHPPTRLRAPQLRRLRQGLDRYKNPRDGLGSRATERAADHRPDVVAGCAPCVCHRDRRCRDQSAGPWTYLDGVFAGLLAPIAYELLSMIKRVGRP